MNIAIMGAGAMGTTLGAYLSARGASPLLIDAYKEHVAALNANGAAITGAVTMCVPVRATTPDAIAEDFDLVFLLVKQLATREALAALKPHLKKGGFVCTLQNGYPEPLVAECIGKERTMGGACRWGAGFVKPGVALVTNDLASRQFLFEIGEMDGGITPRLRRVAEVLALMGPVEIADNFAGARWLKLMLNSSMSGLSAALGCPFGDILDNSKALTCLSYLAAEVVRVCRATGTTMTRTNNLNPDEIADFATKEELERSIGYLYRNYVPLRRDKPSMLQDLEAGRKTEVDMINGHVCDEGRRTGVPTPFNDLVRGIVHKIEDGELPLSFDNLKLFTVPDPPS